MKLAIITAYPPSKVTLNEYGYYLVKNFRVKKEITELILLTDVTKEAKIIDFKEKGCKISVVECWKFNKISNFLTISKAIEKTKPDAILLNLQFMKFGDKKIPAALGLTLPYIFKLKKIPTIVLLHNILEKVDLNKAGFTGNKTLASIYNYIGTVLTKLILKANVVTVTINKYVGIIEDKYKATNIKCIPHGTFEELTEPSYSIPKGPKKIMTFGKFGTYKKVEVLIEAVEKLRATEEIDLEIIIAGTDNPNVPGYLKKVKETFKHVPKLVFTGYVEESAVPKLFEESSVVVFPYTSTTGSSGVLHQAGSYGRAVVMPNIDDLATLSEQEGYKAEYFETENASSLATALNKIIKDDTYRMSLGKANYEAATKYPMSKIAQMYLDTFTTIISEVDLK
ncbi:glycosyltransferase [Tenacibaculum halocynthiae]|uniref:glycosyltransferase n=1 Tax=Tenacibaculum halocynthiae TaxID=1254437 RepID=UPI003D65442C